MLPQYVVVGVSFIEYIIIYHYSVHEHNHTRVLVPEVLCSLLDPETQNCIRIKPIRAVS